MCIIRLATESDLDAILAIYNDVILNTAAVFHYDIHTRDMRREWFETKKQQGYPVYVADVEGQVAGFSTIGPFRPWPAYKYTVENSVYVDAAFRGRGLGKKLVEPLVRAAMNLNLHTIIAGIEAENINSVRLHESLGFREVAHFKQVGFKFGRWLDLRFLQLILDTPGDPVDG